jgi:hypothetical protein
MVSETLTRLPLALTNGLKIIDPVTAPHTLENCVLLV